MNTIKLYGAEISYDFDGSTATAVHGDQTETFVPLVDEKTGATKTEPNPQQQAIAWAKERQREALAKKEAEKQAKITKAVDEAKAKRKPKPAAKEGDSTQ